jgi:aspartate-semialdehyde dehydrogenase
MVLNPLMKFGIDSVVVSTYQAASGAGIAAMEELEGQVKDYASGKELKKDVFGRQYLFNCFPHNSKINDDGFNGEERKMINETKKILGLTKVFPTCVRVPVLRCHSESIHVKFTSNVNIKDIEDEFKKAPGVVHVHDIDTLLGTEKEEVFVSRVRQLLPNTVELFVVGDQILKGAALNAVQIMEKLLNRA